MKRWQALGEVEDSEDDDELIFDDFELPEQPPRKRQKQNPISTPIRSQNGNTTEIKPQNLPAEDAENEAWVRPRVTRTYGWKANVPKHTPPSGNLAATATAIKRQGRSSEDEHASPEELLERPGPAAQETRTLAGTPSSPPTTTPAHENDISVGKITPEPATQATSQAADSDKEDMNAFDDAEERAGMETTSSSVGVQLLEIAPKTLPAPHSLRATSPCVEIPTIYADLIPAQPRAASSSQRNEEARQPYARRPNHVEVPTSTTSATRNLRNRKPEQLNPYQVERLSYLQHCRARGVEPVKLADRELDQEESQDASQSAHDHDSTPPTSSPIRHEQHVPASNLLSLSYFDDAGTSSDEDVRTPDRQQEDEESGRHKKRRRIDARSGQRDEYSVPPSPPHTSRDSSVSGEMFPAVSRRTASGFMLPLGFTPGPLPTPQVSSEARFPTTKSPSNSEVHIRSSRISRKSRRISESSSSESSDDEREVDTKQLRREQKRIRGVLPASWLKLDLRARTTKHQSPSERNASRTASPERHLQRGVARQLNRNGSVGPIDRLSSPWPDNGYDSEYSLLRVTSERPQRPTSDTPSTFPRDFIEIPGDDDDDLMENDFVDPMLAGGNSRTTKRKATSRRQPRITEAFSKTSAGAHDLSAERIPSKPRINNNHGRSRQRTTTRRPRESSRPNVRLSIADVTRPTSSGSAELPAFVRVALRHSRRQADFGRHSPTYKFVRLATAEDTEEATSTLRAWRNGNLAPRSNNEIVGVPSARPEDERRSPFPTASSALQQRKFTPPVSHKKTSFNVRPRQGPAQMQQMRLRLPRQEPSGRIPRATVRGADHGNPIQRTQRPSEIQRLRGAQLETLERDFDDNHRTAVFERRMQCLTESVALPSRQAPISRLQLDQFLIDPDTRQGLAAVQEHDGLSAAVSPGAPSRVSLGKPRQSRKTISRRLEIEAPQFRQASEPPDEVELHATQELLTPDDAAGAVLLGLGSFGSRYPVDFDVQPLPPLARFADNSFIGSCELENALRLNERELDQANGNMRICVDGAIHEWSAWTDQVATQLSRVPKAIREAFQSLESTPPEPPEQLHDVECNAAYLLRSAVRYCSKCLYFSDPVDRKPCIDVLERVITELSDVVTESLVGDIVPSNTVIDIRQYQVVLAKQARDLCDHPVIPLGYRTKLDDLLHHQARGLASCAVMGRLHELGTLYNNIHCSQMTEGDVIQEDSRTMSSIVILNHILSNTRNNHSFWQILDLPSGLNISKACSVADFEKIWHTLFLVLPALTINTAGVSCAEAKISCTQENWELVKALIGRLFEMYDVSSRIRGYTVNEYLRTLLRRVHCLVNSWGWWHCGSILNLIYDFFAQRNLDPLRNEESHGSPKFLEELSDNPSFEVLPDDRSFHIFLKLISSALIGMRKQNIYGNTKITGIAWRLLPNHSRTCRKDQDLQRSELEALRNHYDLLCTLYYAMPPGHRINIDTPRSLVDQATSHREACRLSVRAWTNITSFQMSTGEGDGALEPLIDWYTEIIRVNTTQYRLAKIEAERAKQEAEKEGIYVDYMLLESTIARNQIEIAKILVDALAGLKRALTSASSLNLANALVHGTRFWTVFDLFDAIQHRLLNVMEEALCIVDTAIDNERQLMASTMATGDGSEESQDFGDSSALQEFVGLEVANHSSSMCSMLISPMSHFVSNVFGADVAADDRLLEYLVNAWVRLAAANVRGQKSTWTEYVDEYSTTSWHQIRDTVQKRKFAPYFMAKVVEQSTLDIEVIYRATTLWLLSLVEREAMLKFQHTLTSTLLNHCRYEPLLHNLPFAEDRATCTFSISLHELRQRRVALIASVLCNMRQEYEETLSSRPSKREEVQSTFRSMLRQLMQTMRTNYQELQTSGSRDVAEASVQGAYVDFVQQVVSALQQHASGICQVDRFFTDSTAFPLPATDPTYVVGRLRSYIPKLREPRTRTQLAVFIQSVSERAATDGQQHYLTQQLVVAMSDVREEGNLLSPTLRHVLLTSVVPPYIENSLHSEFAWILAVPMLQACEQIVADLVYDVRIEEESSVRATTQILSSVLESIGTQFDHLLGETDRLDQRHVARLSCQLISVAISSLTVASFVRRSTLSDDSAVSKQLERLFVRFVAVGRRLEGANDSVDLDGDPLIENPRPWPDTRHQAEKQIREALCNWSVSNGQHWVRRGNVSKQVVVQLQTLGEEKWKLLQAIQGFCEAFDAVKYPGRRTLRAARDDDLLYDLVIRRR